MAKPSIQELSAQTKYDAAITATNKGYDSNNKNDMERKKAMQQGDELLKHMDPETVKKVEDFAKQLGLDYTIKKESIGSQFEPTIIIVLGKNLKSPNLVQSAPIKVYITKDTSKVEGILPDQPAERKLGMLIKYIQQKELAVNLKSMEQMQETKRKLNALIDKVINEELDSAKIEEKTYVGKNAVPDLEKDPNYTRLPGQTKQSVKRAVEKGEPTVVEEETPTPPATEIAGKIAEMMDSLKAISEGTQDPKMKKIADKAAAQLDAAKQTLEALTAHEVMLHEKEQQKYVKEAAKKRKIIERYLKKTVKMPEIVEKLMRKLPDEKIAEMMRKSEKELDEQQLAGAMVRVALKESYIKLG